MKSILQRIVDFLRGLFSFEPYKNTEYIVPAKGQLVLPLMGDAGELSRGLPTKPRKTKSYTKAPAKRASPRKPRGFYKSRLIELGVDALKAGEKKVLEVPNGLDKEELRNAASAFMYQIFGRGKSYTRTFKNEAKIIVGRY